MFDDMKNRLRRLESAGSKSMKMLVFDRDDDEPPSKQEMELRKRYPNACVVLLGKEFRNV